MIFQQRAEPAPDPRGVENKIDLPEKRFETTLLTFDSEGENMAAESSKRP